MVYPKLALYQVFDAADPPLIEDEAEFFELRFLGTIVLFKDVLHDNIDMVDLWKVVVDEL